MAIDEGSPGEWRLTYQPDWVTVLSSAVLLAAVVAGCWLLAAGRPPRTIGPYVLAAVLASAVLLVGGTMPGFASIGCDGSVPRWMLPDDYDGSGCIPWPENAEVTQPWDNEEMVCLGLCGDETLPFR
jgi:hypothetical protein